MVSADRTGLPDPLQLIELPTAPDGVTWRILRGHAQRLLVAAGVPAPESEARWVVEEASGWEGSDHFARLDELAPTAGVASFQQMVSRRCSGEPLQYVLGHWSFRRLDLAVDRRVLIPRPETEVVAGIAIEELVRGRSAHLDGSPSVVVDLGAGSGAIGLSVAVEGPPGTQVWLTDVSVPALAVARANLAGIGRAGVNVFIAEGAWFDALPNELAGMIDVVVSNPPYVADHETLPDEVAEFEPSLALRSGPTGLECYSELAASARHWLRPDGALVVEIAPHQVDDVCRLLRAGIGDARIDWGTDLAGRSRWVRAQRQQA